MNHFLINVLNDGDEEILANRFVELTPELIGMSDAAFAVELPRGTRATGVLGVVDKHRLAPKGTGFVQCSGLAFVDVFGPVARRDLLAVCTEDRFRGYGRRAVQGDEVVAMAIGGSSGPVGQVKVLLGPRAILPGGLDR